MHVLLHRTSTCKGRGHDHTPQAAAKHWQAQPYAPQQANLSAYLHVLLHLGLSMSQHTRHSSVPAHQEQRLQLPPDAYDLLCLHFWPLAHLHTGVPSSASLVRHPRGRHKGTWGSCESCDGCLQGQEQLLALQMYRINDEVRHSMHLTGVGPSTSATARRPTPWVDWLSLHLAWLLPSTLPQFSLL